VLNARVLVATAREWDAADGNLTAHHRRELLAMRGGKSITDAFQASTLWSKGYSGSKVNHRPHLARLLPSI
jgi:hypothetical protein